MDSPLLEFRGKHAQILPCLDTKRIPIDHPEQKSYAEIDGNGMVTKTAEKQVISDYVIAGMFYFQDFSTYIGAFERMKKDNAKAAGEFFIAPMFNYLTDTRWIEVSRFFDLGEPANVEQFILQQQFLSKEFQFVDRLGIDYTRM